MEDGLSKVEEELAYLLCGRILNQIQVHEDFRDGIHARLRDGVGDRSPPGGLIDLVSSEEGMLSQRYHLGYRLVEEEVLNIVFATEFNEDDMPLHLKFVLGDRDHLNLLILNHCGDHDVYDFFYFINSEVEDIDGFRFIEFRPKLNVEKLVLAKVFEARGAQVVAKVEDPYEAHYDQSKFVKCDHPDFQPKCPICNTCELLCK